MSKGEYKQVTSKKYFKHKKQELWQKYEKENNRCTSSTVTQTRLRSQNKHSINKNRQNKLSQWKGHRKALLNQDQEK